MNIKNFRGNGINWNDMSQTIEKCANATGEKDPKLNVFALRYYGECNSGYNELEKLSTYQKMPYSDDNDKYCWSGVGRAHFSFVYAFEK